MIYWILTDLIYVALFTKQIYKVFQEQYTEQKKKKTIKIPKESRRQKILIIEFLKAF